MTLRDLFTQKQSYIVEIKIDENYHLWIEGLSELGSSIDDKFNVDNIKNLCIELIDSQEGDYINTIDSYGITLDSVVEDLKELVKGE